MNTINTLQALYLSDHLAHSWIFEGAEITNLLLAADNFAQWLLCNNKQQQQACGTCKACLLFIADTHPDLCRILPLQDKNTIAIDDVRIATDFAIAKPQISRSKVVLLYPAEALPKQAANALLKTLEEPRGATFFILLCKNHVLLLKTIISRCHILNFSTPLLLDTELKPITQQIVNDLSKLWLDKNVTCSQIVEQWIKQWPEQVLYWFEIVLTDIIRFKYTNDVALAKAWVARQEQLASGLATSKLWNMLERLRQAQYCFGQNWRPNMQLVLENILVA